MKLQERLVEAFLINPGEVRIVLLHGDDAGLVRDLGRRLTEVVAGAVDDPFRAATLDRDTHASLFTEMIAESMSGGRRVVRVRDGGDGLVGALTSGLARAGDTLVVVEAGVLPPRSRIRVFVESSDSCMAIACNGGGSRVNSVIAHTFEHAKISADADAVAWLVANLPADSAAVGSELDKLVTFVGIGATVTLGDVSLCLSDMGQHTAESAAVAAAAGQTGRSDRAIGQATDEGTSPVTLVRTLLTHFQRLYSAGLSMQGGRSPRDAAASLTPPVFARSMPAFVDALAGWPLRELERVVMRLLQLERDCKRTGAPASMLVHREFLRVAERARARRRP